MNKKDQPVEEAENELVIVPNQQMTLEEKVSEETHNRAILTGYIASHMVKGTDYAAIHISKTCDNKYNCTNKYHFSKDNLTKAGAEKIRSLLKLRPETIRDNDTWEMAGSKPGLFCYRCNLYDLTTGQLVGDGLGACDQSEKMGNMNNAIKIAKKRAFVDAILSTGSLSDFFTQDLEDIEHTSSSLTPQAVKDSVKSQIYADMDRVEKERVVVIPMINETQKIEIMGLLGKKGKTLDDLDNAVSAFKKGSYKELSEKQAEQLLIKMRSLPDKETQPELEINVDEADEEIEKAKFSGHKGGESKRADGKIWCEKHPTIAYDPIKYSQCYRCAMMEKGK